MSDAALLWGGGALLALAVVGAVVGSVKEQAQWDNFAKQNNCRKVGEISSTSTTAVGFGTNGQMTVTPVYVPGKIGWSCDDGVTYWR